MVAMSRTRGTRRSTTGASASSVAARAGRAAFLAPLAATVPTSRVGPVIWKRSIARALWGVGGVGAGAGRVVDASPDWLGRGSAAPGLLILPEGSSTGKANREVDVGVTGCIPDS